MKEKFMNIIKTSLFLILEISYFIFYFLKKALIENFLTKHTFYDFTLAYSYFNALIAFFLVISLFEI
jgi:hypothetical protein